MDPSSLTRSYSTTAYYLPAASRPNLVLLTNSVVTEVLIGGSSGDLVATGVQFQHSGEHFSVSASREVILCAGSVQSPQILELSGIGDPDVLSRAAVPLKVNNPNVGENLQDHISEQRSAHSRNPRTAF